MATRKRTRPALYELMKGQRIYSPSQQMPAERSTNHELDHEPSAPTVSWLDRLRAGHSMRIPIGYIFLGIPAVLLIVVVAYIFGFSRGETIPSDTDAATPDFAVNDPLARPLLNEPANPTTSRSASAAPQPANATSPLVFDITRLPPIDTDPRQRGMNYYVLATPDQAGAQRLARFCREHALAAFIVPAPGKPHLRQVIVLPGFDAAALSSDLAKEFTRMILHVGQKWDEVEPGKDDLSTFYPQRYNG
jgi:hypothetical protein